MFMYFEKFQNYGNLCESIIREASLGCSEGVLSAVLCHEGKRISYPHISVASLVTTLTP